MTKKCDVCQRVANALEQGQQEGPTDQDMFEAGILVVGALIAIPAIIITLSLITQR